MLKDFFVLGFKNLKKRGIRSWLTLLGIFIGIVAVVALISLGDGLRAVVNSQFGVSSKEVITIQGGGISGYGPPGTGVVNPLTKQDRDAIGKLDTIALVASRTIPSIKLEFNNKFTIGFAGSVPDGEARKFLYENSDIKIAEGRELADGDSGKIMLGYNFILDNNPFTKEIRTGDSLTIQDKNFRVIGIVAKKGSFILDNLVYVNEQDLDNLMGNGDEVDIIIAKVKNPELMEKAKQQIEDLLRKRRNLEKGQEDFEVSTPEASLATINQILAGVQAFIVLIAFVSILVGAIGIVNTMATSVLERRKEIGIMKAIGARNGDIFKQFLIEAGLLGLVGGAAGVIFGSFIGFLGTAAINNFIGASTTSNLNFILIIGALTGSFLVGAISGLVPAMNAARQNPVEALRG
jgi:putative ABC transport system permease protein